MTIGKGELISQIAHDTSIHKTTIQQVLDVYFDKTKKLLQEGQEIRIMGFGSFRVQETSERQGINSQTKEKLTIPASKRVIFRSGKELKEAIRFQ